MAKWSCISLVVGSIFATVPAMAQTDNYPSRPIKMVIPLAAGGPIDTLGRTLAEPMGAALGQKIVVENVVGAGATIGHAQVARSDPDGYTILLTHVAMATGGALYKNLPYDSQKSFAPIGLVTEFPTILVARPNLPSKDGADALAYMKANRDKITVGHAGVGSATHLCMLLIMNALGGQVNMVPYKGTAPALVDLMADRLDFMCDGPTPAAKENVESGRIKGVFAMTRQRMKALPNMPTVHELGNKELEFYTFHAMYAPAGTPDAIIAKLAKALTAALKDEAVIKRLDILGAEPATGDAVTPEAVRKKLDAEIRLWGPLIAKAGVTAN
ncbi:Bug family tripartite tricarboxylate transporter substrate binding protein [Pseudorhodoplanes sp.]|uniref:Bug family tripartite tricarboxylate transporter substrate binding protein n=1 Tax=Pseudorhodoplanes sp. TaxID=1934341 RepID=UPI002C6EC7AB|nr:tripartite tricarboxylate transporter substrate-binding protein [Pseudorhodoplanes sp.]HWV54324.1 tripartite tricarboxylate transporter substrate-binding protein [Pseudorhodoplanes sp.]